MDSKALRVTAVLGTAAGLALAVVPAAASAAQPHAHPHAVSHAPNHRVVSPRDHVTGHTKSAQQSSNWSGYAETGSYTSATATWTVPTVTTTSDDRYSSDWVGIDGYNNSDLIQLGTEQDSIGGQAQYQAWWEILPAAETPIDSVSISPGDSITATIQSNGDGTWNMSLTDNSNGQSFSTTQSYSGPGASVEYIEEAPEVGGSIASPAELSQSDFSGLTANGNDPGLTSSDEIDLVQNGTTYYQPSLTGTNSFSVSYTG